MPITRPSKGAKHWKRAALRLAGVGLTKGGDQTSDENLEDVLARVGKWLGRDPKIWTAEGPPRTDVTEHAGKRITRKIQKMGGWSLELKLKSPLYDPRLGPIDGRPDLDFTVPEIDIPNSAVWRQIMRDQPWSASESRRRINRMLEAKLMSPEPELQLEGLHGLWEMTINRENQEDLTESQLSTLLEAVLHEDIMCAAVATAAIWNLVATYHARETLLEKGLCDILVQAANRLLQGKLPDGGLRLSDIRPIALPQTALITAKRLAMANDAKSEEAEVSGGGSSAGGTPTKGETPEGGEAGAAGEAPAEGAPEGTAAEAPAEGVAADGEGAAAAGEGDLAEDEAEAAPGGVEGGEAAVSAADMAAEASLEAARRREATNPSKDPSAEFMEQHVWSQYEEAILGALGVLFVDKGARESYIKVDPQCKALIAMCRGELVEGGPPAEYIAHKKSLAARALCMLAHRDPDIRLHIMKSDGILNAVLELTDMDPSEPGASHVKLCMATILAIIAIDDPCMEHAREAKLVIPLFATALKVLGDTLDYLIPDSPTYKGIDAPVVCMAIAEGMAQTLWGSAYECCLIYPCPITEEQMMQLASLGFKGIALQRMGYSMARVLRGLVCTFANMASNPRMAEIMMAPRPKTPPPPPPAGGQKKRK